MNLQFFEFLDTTDMDWIVSHVHENRHSTDDCLIDYDIRLEHIWLVTSGLFTVLQRHEPSHVEVDRIGPGEVIALNAILDGDPSNVRITALEPSITLSLSQSALDSKFRMDPKFAMRFYRAIALHTARRLKDKFNQQARNVSETGREGEIFINSDSIKVLVTQLDKKVRKTGKGDSSLEREIKESFTKLMANVERFLGDTSPLDARRKGECGSRLQSEWLPFVLLTRWAQRAYTKPRGYTGDAKTIDLIYENTPGGSEYVGRILDDCFLTSPAAQAVRNRRGLVKNELIGMLKNSSEPLRVTSLACGHAHEIFDTFDGLPEKNKLFCQLIDFDPEALKEVAENADRAGISEQVRVLTNNLIHLILGRESLRLPPQDMVYSIGLIDYLEDSLVIKLLDKIHGWLSPGGRVMLGNFHPRNPNRKFMEYVLEWKLIHRTEDDLNALFLHSKFGTKATEIRFEGEGVNLFAFCHR